MWRLGCAVLVTRMVVARMVVWCVWFHVFPLFLNVEPVGGLRGHQGMGLGAWCT